MRSSVSYIMYFVKSDSVASSPIGTTLNQDDFLHTGNLVELFTVKLFQASHTPLLSIGLRHLLKCPHHFTHYLPLRITHLLIQFYDIHPNRNN